MLLPVILFFIIIPNVSISHVSDTSLTIYDLIKIFPFDSDIDIDR